MPIQSMDTTFHIRHASYFKSGGKLKQTNKKQGHKKTHFIQKINCIYTM